MNITRDDIIDMVGLTEDEVQAIAEHEHVPEISAAALADYLLHRADGVDTIKRMIRDDIRAALIRGDRAHAASLIHAFHHFMESART
ncbi:hypothetical protein [Chthonobacter albigriseus]|uniref:hypothetical protein n=1 Tax=Chthonobacter albigriseus TaxID=1683161 RepID=UPI0015EFD1D9|nr:hypothetical protein [Chthonobacter albigriseus]